MEVAQRIEAVGIAALTGMAGSAQVRTPVGPRRIENVRAGDLIVTRDHGLQPVRMVWTHEIGAAQIAASADNAPVSLAVRAIGPMMPQRRLVLAPGHKVLMPSYLLSCDADIGGFIEARALAGSSDLIWYDRDAEGTQFFNLVFDRHEVVVADGLPVESFRPTPESLRDLASGTRLDITRRFPVLREKRGAFPAADYINAEAGDYFPAPA